MNWESLLQTYNSYLIMPRLHWETFLEPTGTVRMEFWERKMKEAPNRHYRCLSNSRAWVVITNNYATSSASGGCNSGCWGAGWWSGLLLVYALPRWFILLIHTSAVYVSWTLREMSRVWGCWKCNRSPKRLTGVRNKRWEVCELESM